MSAPVGKVPAVQGSSSALSDLEKRVLVFEREWMNRPATTIGGRPVAAWGLDGAKEVAAKDEFGLSQIRYLQVLNGMLEKPAAMAEDPQVVNRLRRLREKYSRTRRRA